MTPAVSHASMTWGQWQEIPPSRVVSSLDRDTTLGAAPHEASRHEWRTSFACSSSWEVHEVWSWNLQQEFQALLAAVAGEGVVVLGLDTEFPGLLWRPPQDLQNVQSQLEAKYRVLVKNIDSVWPIQVGFAVARGGGAFNSVWNFHLAFDISADLHTKAAVSLLRAAGMDFARHASEGIEPVLMGGLLARSPLFGWHDNAPLWITFAGEYDLGFLLKLLVAGSPLPQDPTTFEEVLAYYFPRRHELRVHIPYGSLDNVATRFSVARRGTAHTAGSDALLTLELYQCELYQCLLASAVSEEAAHARSWGFWSEEGWCASSWDNSWGFNNWNSFEDVDTLEPGSFSKPKAAADTDRKSSSSSADAVKEMLFSADAGKEVDSQVSTGASSTARTRSKVSAAEDSKGDGDDDDAVSSVSGMESSSEEDVDGVASAVDADQVSDISEVTESANLCPSSEATDPNQIRSRVSLSSASWKPSSLNVSFLKASAEYSGHPLIFSAMVSLESFYVVAVFVFSLLLLVLFPPCLSSLILLPLHMVLLMLVRSWASPSQPSVLISAYLVGCCIRLGAAIAAAGTRFWMNA